MLLLVSDPVIECLAIWHAVKFLALLVAQPLLAGLAAFLLALTVTLKHARTPDSGITGIETSLDSGCIRRVFGTKVCKILSQKYDIL